MNHGEAVELMATERYLLDEFTPEVKEKFEEHLFTCQECALDVRMASSFIEGSKKALSARPAIVSLPTPSKPRMLTYFWPGLAISAAVVFLTIFGFQTLVVQPRMSKAIADLRRPQVLASAYLGSGTTRGDNRPTITVHPEQPFVLFIDIPADKRFQAYVAQLFNPAGTKLWSLTIPARTVESATDALPIRIAPVGDVPGEYRLIVKGLNSGSVEGMEIQQYAFHINTH